MTPAQSNEMVSVSLTEKHLQMIQRDGGKSKYESIQASLQIHGKHRTGLERMIHSRRMTGMDRTRKRFLRLVDAARATDPVQGPVLWSDRLE